MCGEKHRLKPGLPLCSERGRQNFIAWNKPLLGRLVAPGLSLGILLGALVIVASWLLTWWYVRWANTHYDPHLESLRQ